MSKLIEDKGIRERFGNLGLYLITKAHEEIRDLNQQTLFQKAEIRKKYLERSNITNSRIRTHFIETYNQFLNDSLTSTIIEFKERILALKNRLVNKLRTDIKNQIYLLIQHSYSMKKNNAYITFLLNSIKNILSNIKNKSSVTITLNQRDYKYFNENPSLIDFKSNNKFSFKQADVSFIGGFKLIQEDENIFYDYTIENLLKKKEVYIQNEFVKEFDDSEIKKMQKNFEDYIQTQRTKIEVLLKEYDRL
ncbi:MAG: hypothetical protein EU535_00890 [Promethearchaeota archaeon]|nr:MAG: hypothetical protein EU535_00890 [Candidatus Lokiarchaeota archaeon]